MSDEHLGECRFLMDCLDDRRFFQLNDDGIRHGRDRCDALPLPGKTALAEEIVRPKDRDDRFLALLGYDGELRLAFLDVENRIRRVPLRIDDLTFAVLADATAFPDTREKVLRIELCQPTGTSAANWRERGFRHVAVFWAAPGQAPT